MSLQPPPSKGYLASTIGALSPWASRPATPQPEGDEQPRGESGKDSTTSAGNVGRRGGDHRLNPRKKIGPKNYPPDCPAPNVQWYHAVDVAKRKPNYAKSTVNEDKPTPPPKKWKTFSTKDSRAIEALFQDLREEEGDTSTERDMGTSGTMASMKEQTNGKDQDADRSRSRNKPNTSMETMPNPEGTPSATVPVNEDFLFDVDIDKRELAPSYWLGPIYEVRRGSWFYVDGTTLRPCDENLAYQLEEGYVKTTPWRRNSGQASGTVVDAKASGSGTSSSLEVQSSTAGSDEISGTTRKGLDENLQAPILQNGIVSYRLFGAYINTFVQYMDGETAYLLTDDFLSRMSGTVYQRFAGGAHLSGTKIVRGYSEASRKRPIKETKRSTTPAPSTSGRKRAASTERPTKPLEKEEPVVLGADANFQGTEIQNDGLVEEHEPESTVQRLERKMTSLLSAVGPDDPAKQDEEAQKLEEQEISDDYRDTSGENQDREIEHLILVTHGIGQRLGQRFETFNFIHDVNELRKMLKAVYNSSPDLQSLNSELDRLPKNCRVQVLPVLWRDQLDFPNHQIKQNRKEYDLAVLDDHEEETYPSIQDITIEGVPAVRTILADLVLDVLLYQTPIYKNHISKIVATECNRTWKLFKERNPSFQGQVSLLGHSLGSAIFFDIASEQPDERPFMEKFQKDRPAPTTEYKLDFEIESLFLLGSPVGLFQMLQGKTLEGRHNPNEVTLDGFDDDIDGVLHNEDYTKRSTRPHASQRSTLVSSPKCRQLFNIFHPTDPIAQRIEPLISHPMAKLKPQNLPYVKKGFLNAPVGQGLTAIPAILGQSVSGLWSNFSSGLADRFIHRSLGISAEDAAKLGVPHTTAGRQAALSAGAGTNILAGGVISSLTPGTFGASAENNGRRPPTLLDAELETLYAGFQSRRDSKQGNEGEKDDNGESKDRFAAGERARYMRKEDAKVRAMNSNGRVDYSIQEGAFDISFFGSIASHLAYWTDEDVGHFLISQLLSKQRVVSTRHLKARSVG